MYCRALMMEAARTSETSVDNYWGGHWVALFLPIYCLFSNWIVHMNEQRMIWSLIDNGFERILREEAIALLKLLSFYLSGGTE
jgi:hypothetical protein